MHSERRICVLILCRINHDIVFAMLKIIGRKLADVFKAYHINTDAMLSNVSDNISLHVFVILNEQKYPYLHLVWVLYVHCSCGWETF